MKNGKLIIFSAPSGAGKTTLVKHLLQQRNDLAFSISCATREKRPTETNGVDYYFISADEFRQKIDNQEFAEWEEVYKDHYYGTLKSEIERIWQENKAVVFDIDVQGGINLKKQFGEAALGIFVQPPSLEILEERLCNRKTDSPEKLKMRIAKAVEELDCATEFDVIVVNRDLQQAHLEVDILVNNFLNN